MFADSIQIKLCLNSYRGLMWFYLAISVILLETRTSTAVTYIFTCILLALSSVSSYNSVINHAHWQL